MSCMDGREGGHHYVPGDPSNLHRLHHIPTTIYQTPQHTNLRLSVITTWLGKNHDIKPMAVVTAQPPHKSKKAEGVTGIGPVNHHDDILLLGRLEVGSDGKKEFQGSIC